MCDSDKTDQLIINTPSILDINENSIALIQETQNNEHIKCAFLHHTNSVSGDTITSSVSIIAWWKHASQQTVQLTTSIGMNDYRATLLCCFIAFIQSWSLFDLLKELMSKSSVDLFSLSIDQNAFVVDITGGNAFCEAAWIVFFFNFFVIR